MFIFCHISDISDRKSSSVEGSSEPRGAAVETALCDGPGCDKLPAHMVLSASHLALLGLRLQAEMPSVQCSHTPSVDVPQSPRSASFGPLGPRQEKPRSWTHSPLPALLWPLAWLAKPSSTSISLRSHTDDPSDLGGDGEVSSTL